MPASNPVNNYSYGVFGLNEARSLIITTTPTAVVGIATTTNVNTLSFVDVGNFSQDSTHGWFGGGYYLGHKSTVDRIDFSNDSTTASVRGPLSSERQQLSATGNFNYGWFGGGINAVPASVSIVDRIDFSNDSTQHL